MVVCPVLTSLPGKKLKHVMHLHAGQNLEHGLTALEVVEQLDPSPGRRHVSPQQTEAYPAQVQLRLLSPTGVKPAHVVRQV